MSTLLIVPFAFEDSLPDDEDAWDDGTDSDSTSDHSNDDDDDDDKDTHNAGKHDQVKADNEPEQPNGIPEKSAVPGQPDKTAKPVEPKKPAEPEQPVKPAEPQQPVKPAEPEQTAKPAEPEPRAASPGKVASEQAVYKSRQDDGSKAGKIVFFPEIFFTCPGFSHSVNRVLGNICARECSLGFRVLSYVGTGLVVMLYHLAH